LKILNRIRDTEDVKGLRDFERLALCKELRETILATVEDNGGHLASNLGVIELTVALHTVFDSLTDRIVWDVGHQCYAHKLLTGRSGEFHTIRRYKGLSGFPKGSESVHDAFDTGHASTAVSAALGLARSRDILGQKHRVIAVVGDGALTGGMSYEALNDAGQSRSCILVILNDNAMAISKSVGGMTSYLSKLRTSPGYLRFKRRIKRVFKAIPGIGRGMLKFAERVRDRIKFFVLPRVFFEELGFTYLGPFDGHDLHDLIDVLGDIKQLNGPIFLHLITQKGKGYAPAEEDPEQYHGLGGSKGSGDSALPSNGTLAGSVLCDLAKEDGRVVAITAAMTTGTGLPWFAKLYPKRFFDVGIAEQHAVTLAAGMAKGGLRPFIAVYSTFLQRAYDQIIHDVALTNLPVVFLIDRAGLVGADGETHQGLFDIAMLMPIPNLCIYSPCDQRELVAAIRAAADANCPAAVRYPRGSLPIGDEDSGKDVDSWRFLSNPNEITILATGRMCSLAKQAAATLEKRGISVGLVEACRIKPMDKAALCRIAGASKHVVTIEEGYIAGGFGSAVAQWADAHAAFTVHPLGIADGFVEHGDVNELMDMLQLTKEAVAEAVHLLGSGQNG
jgi:1-deoxy-D-xylulose-5-phosphate synthase